MSHLKRKGYLDKDGEVVLNPEADDIFAENDSLTQATASSIAGKIAFGPNAGRYVTRIGSGSENKDQKAIKNYSWSKMLEKVFKIDVSTCDSCGADMVAVCSIMERESIIRYLKHINIDYDPPERSPPRLSQVEFDFDQTLKQQPAEDNVIYLDS